VRNVRRIVERHPATRGLRPLKAEEWAADRFTVRRPKVLRDPSMLARGVVANITGSRADAVICDDVEVPNTAETAEQRAELRRRLAEIDFVLVPGGLQLYVGTPHALASIYAREARAEAGEERPSPASTGSSCRSSTTRAKAAGRAASPGSGSRACVAAPAPPASPARCCCSRWTGARPGSTPASCAAIAASCSTAAVPAGPR
jgi:hypothetical protein